MKPDARPQLSLALSGYATSIYPPVEERWSHPSTDREYVSGLEKECLEHARDCPWK